MNPVCLRLCQASERNGPDWMPMLQIRRGVYRNQATQLLVSLPGKYVPKGLQGSGYGLRNDDWIHHADRPSRAPNQPPALGYGDNPVIGGWRLIAAGLCFGVAYQCPCSPSRLVFNGAQRSVLGCFEAQTASTHRQRCTTCVKRQRNLAPRPQSEPSVTTIASTGRQWRSTPLALAARRRLALSQQRRTAGDPRPQPCNACAACSFSSTISQMGSASRPDRGPARPGRGLLGRQGSASRKCQRGAWYRA
jgi:hypothetical protein